MKFLPFEHIVYHSNLNAPDVIRRLEGEIQAPQNFRSGFLGFITRSNITSYEGSIFNNNKFEISRVIAYRNSFLPKISGTIEQAFDGTRIEVKMRPVIFVIVFMCVWFGGVSIAILVLTIEAIISWKFSAINLLPFGMFLFGYLLTMGAFKAESLKSKKDLKNIFEAEIIKS